jgi:hypothetical protein
MSDSSRHMTTRLDYRDALRLMSKPGHRLTQTNGRRGAEYFVVPGGPVTDATARRILDHSLCRKDDAGLFPEAPQSWVLTSAASDT